MSQLNLLLAIAGILSTFAAVVVSHLWTRRSNRRPRLSFVVDDDPIYGPELTPVDIFELSVSGQVVERVSRSRVAVWQSHGSGVVQYADVAANDPLVIRCNGGRILHHVLACDSGARNAIDLEVKDESELVVGFDYLELGHGFVAEVYVSGSEPVEVTGSIKGAEIKRSPWQPISPTRLGGDRRPSRILALRLGRAVFTDMSMRGRIQLIVALVAVGVAAYVDQRMVTLGVALLSGWYFGALTYNFYYWEEKFLPGSISQRRLAPGWREDGDEGRSGSDP
ncbi:MAG: hypothetical protein AAGA93_06140 [Actinomycetota bacterium]